MKIAQVFALVTTLGLTGAYLAAPASIPIEEPRWEQLQAPQNPPPKSQPVIPVIKPPDPWLLPVFKKAVEAKGLERARSAVFDIGLIDYKTSGSATLVSRIKLTDGKYRYRALTAYHVIDDMSKAITKDKTKASHRIRMTFQLKFHGDPLQFTQNISGITWAVPDHDWAAFTFESKRKLPCAEVATRKDFTSIKMGEAIFIIACKGAYGQQCMKGIIATTHNVGTRPKAQSTNARYAWHKHPKKFFRLSAPVWYGDSGGGVFTKGGKLIGIVCGFTIYAHNDWGQGGFLPHSGVAVKGHEIREAAQYSTNFFLVEK